MEQIIEEFIKCKNIAVVGVSRDAKKFGNLVYTELQQRGYNLFTVNPAMQSFNTKPCYPNLAALKGKVDGVVISLSPQKALSVIRDAEQNNIKYIWLQQGAESAEALKTAQQLELTPVVKKCILMYAPPVTSIHKFHRFFARVFGQL